MNLLHLEYFRTLAKVQNMTKAASELHITQPTLSNSLKRLEQELGMQLFDRCGRSLQLNSAGEEFLKSINSIFNLLGSQKQLHTITGTESCTEITIGGMRSENPLVPLILRFMQAHPNIVFRIISLDLMNITRDHKRVDFLITSSIEEIPASRKCCLYTTEPYVVLPKEHRLSNQPCIDIGELSEDSQILCTTPDIAMPRGLSLCIRAGLSPKVRYITEDRFSALMMLLQGDHIMFSPKEDALVLHSQTNGRLVAKPLTSDHLPPDWYTQVYLSWKKLSSAAQEFLSFVMQELHLNAE